MDNRKNLMNIYKSLFEQFGQQKWWPISGKFKPPQFEVCIGAILTQNTNWKNVEKALVNMLKSKKTSAESVVRLPAGRLQKLIRPAGFFRQKSKRLKELADFIITYDGNFYNDVTREQLLSINGIGRETADSILLYACNKPFFVVDAYTRRLFSRLGVVSGVEDYDEIRNLFESGLPKDAELYKEFHALIVEQEKQFRKQNKIM